jgi:hypothetical protein
MNTDKLTEHIAGAHAHTLHPDLFLANQMLAWLTPALILAVGVDISRLFTNRTTPLSQKLAARLEYGKKREVT